MKQAWIQWIGLGILSTVVLTFTGCEPPAPTVADSGHQIVQVAKPTSTKPYKTVERDGIEFKQSPFPIGQFGETFYMASIGRAPKTFNAFVSKDATSSQIAGLMFEGLTETDPYTGEHIPHLAKSVEVLPDDKTYVVTLRKGLEWSDGKPITADDVVFTWNKIIKSGLGNPSNRDVISINGKLPIVKKLNELTVAFQTPEPFAPFMGNLGMSVFPKHVVEPVIQEDPKAFDSFWGVNADPKSFVVNGKFIIDEYVSGQRVVLRKNPKYFMVNLAGDRLPYFDRYVFEFVQDQNAQVLQFEQGRIDQVPVPGSQVFYVKHLGTPKFKMYDLGPNSGTTFLVFNLNPRKNKETGRPYVDPLKSKWFRDIHFRKAVDYAIRRDQIVQNILMGVGAPLFTAESLSSIFLNPDLADGHPADIEKAKAFLRQGGFSWNAKGQLLDSEGNIVEFDLLTNTGNLEREAVGVSLKQDFEKLGMKVNFKPIDFNVLVGKFDTADWQAVILGLTGSNLEPHGGVNVWRSDGALHMFNQRFADRDDPQSEIIEPWEKELDQLFHQGSTTLDKHKRRQIYYQYQQVAYDNLPFIYLYSGKSIVAVQEHLKNLDPTPLGGVFHNMESIWKEIK